MDNSISINRRKTECQGAKATQLYNADLHCVP